MYEGKNVPALKAIAKERGIKGYSKLRKPELLQALQTWDRENTPKAEAAPEAAPIVEPIRVKGRSVGATTMAAAKAADSARIRFTTYPNTTARNAAKRKRRAIRANGGVAGWA
jgi:hypothetical protein